MIQLLTVRCLTYSLLILFKISTMSVLFSPYKIGPLVLKNRIVISPMCQYSAVDGFANNWHLVHLGARAVGGAALIIQEATAVVPEGRISYADLGIWKDEHTVKLKEIVDFVHSQGSKIGVQLAHAGRKASCDLPWKGGHPIEPHSENGWQTVGPSAVPFKEGHPVPAELSKTEIKSIIDAFATAAIRAKNTGYDLVEIHGAHGYLIHEFFSPLSNHRTDEYGGSFENRIRFLVETVIAVRKAVGENYPVIVRISASDWTEGGWTINDSVLLAKELEKIGVNMIDVSSGGNVLARIPLEPGYQVPFAEQIKKAVKIPVGAVGLITTPQQAEQILIDGKADFILIARESLRDPHFPLHAAKALGEDIEWPNQYVRAK